MWFEKADVIERYGVQKRCLDENNKITDMLIIDILYDDAIYFIVSDNGDYVGSLSRRLLLEYTDIDNLRGDMPLKEACSLVPDCYAYWTERDYNDLDKELGSIAKMFSNYAYLKEIPVVNKSNKRLIGIVDKNILFSCMLSDECKVDEPLLKSAYHKYYEKSSGGLNKYAYNVNSQYGEDGILKKIFETIGYDTKFAVEFGGWDGIHLSNIRRLIIEEGFSGLFIEGEPDKAKQCSDHYKEFPNVKCVQGFVGFEQNKTLNEFFMENDVPTNFDLLSIDIDGYDYYVWDSLKDYRPKVVVVEFNSTIPNDIFFVQPKTEKIRQGASAAALVSVGIRKGYSLVAVTETNCIFVLNQYYNSFHILDNSLGCLRNNSFIADGKFFQTYDKKLYYLGIPGFIWSKEEFSSNQFLVKEGKEQEIEIVHTLKEYLAKLIPSLEQLAIDLQGERNTDTNEFLSACMEGLDWVMEVYNNISGTILENSRLGLQEENFNSNILELERAIKCENDIETKKILDIAVIPFLRTIEESF